MSKLRSKHARTEPEIKFEKRTAESLQHMLVERLMQKRKELPAIALAALQSKELEARCQEENNNLVPPVSRQRKR